MGDELANEDNLRFVWVAKSDDDGTGMDGTVEPAELKTFAAGLGMGDCDRCLFWDGDKESGGFAAFDKFKNANPDLTITEGVPMVIDKKMKIRQISGTAIWESYPLDTIQECLAE